MTKHVKSTPTVTHTTATAVLRIAFGLIFMAHGWQKFTEFTIPGTVEAFTGMGIPAAELAAPAVAVIELAGGALLILGLLTRPAAVLLTAAMLGALVLVHLSAGLFVTNGGYELVLALAAGAAAIALLGAGRASLDQALFASRSGALARLA